MKVQCLQIKFLPALIAGIAASLVVASPPALSEEFSGPVVGVSDGDTLTVLHDGHPERLRLNGIDCPEKRQAFGSRAKHLTSSLALGQTVRVDVSTIDKYGRSVADVTLPDGKSLNHQLVGSGLAWHYRRYSSDPTLAQLEQQARASGSGLWSEPAPIAPWNYRLVAKHHGIPSQFNTPKFAVRSPGTRYNSYSILTPATTGSPRHHRYP